MNVPSSGAVNTAATKKAGICSIYDCVTSQSCNITPDYSDFSFFLPYFFPVLLNLASYFLQFQFSFLTGTSRLGFDSLFRNYKGPGNPRLQTRQCNFPISFLIAFVINVKKKAVVLIDDGRKLCSKPVHFHICKPVQPVKWQHNMNFGIHLIHILAAVTSAAGKSKLRVFYYGLVKLCSVQRCVPEKAG